MSETTERPDVAVPEVASEDDVRRTLQELRRKTTELENELTTERSRRAGLETQVEGERVARTAAETDRDSHAARVVSEAEARWTAERSATLAAIAAKEAALESAEDDYARHLELGEYKDVAKTQRLIASAAAELLTLKQKHEYLENNKERLVPKAPPPRTEVRQEPKPQQTTNRYAQYINGDLVGGEEAWLDARPKFQSDQRYREKVFSASAIAATEYARGSEGYFREIERILGEDDGRQRQDNNSRDPQPRQQPRNQSADLPASRRAGPGQNPAGSQEQIRLTADEAEVADGMYGDPNNTEWYIADQGERYRHYHKMKQRKAGNR